MFHWRVGLLTSLRPGRLGKKRAQEQPAMQSDSASDLFGTHYLAGAYAIDLSIYRRLLLGDRTTAFYDRVWGAKRT